jgi:hypothetical protein
MIKQLMAVAAAVMISGCTSQSSNAPSQSQAKMQNSQMAPTPAPTEGELAAYAGAHPYPSSTPAKNELRAAAIVNADQGYIKIYNFGTHAIRDADVWVNQGFVRHVSAIGPGSNVTIQMSNLYNGVGQQFSARGEHVNLVQVEQDHELQTLMGPAPQ